MKVNSVRELFNENECEAIFRLVKPFRCLENATSVAECLVNSNDYDCEVMVVEGLAKPSFQAGKKEKLDEYVALDPLAAPFKRGEMMVHYWLRVSINGKTYDIDPTHEKYDIVDCFSYSTMRLYKAEDAVRFTKNYTDMIDSICNRAKKSNRTSFSDSKRFSTGTLIEYGFKIFPGYAVVEMSVTKKNGLGELVKVSGNGVYQLLENCLKNGVNIIAA